jgi:hypothetical protein
MGVMREATVRDDEINERCAKSSRKRYENNSKKWKKQLLEV